MPINESNHPEDFLIGQITQEICITMLKPRQDTLEHIRVALVEYYIDRLTRVPESLTKYVMYDLKKIMRDTDKSLLAKTLSRKLQEITNDAKI